VVWVFFGKKTTLLCCGAGRPKFASHFNLIGLAVINTRNAVIWRHFLSRRKIVNQSPNFNRHDGIEWPGGDQQQGINQGLT
jgi:hypothetical protein